MQNITYSVQKAQQLFSSQIDVESLRKQVGGKLPAFARNDQNHRALKSWSTKEIGTVGEAIGFLPHLKVPQAIAVFMTKGGVLKSTITLNLGRLAALHGVRTCVVGLDMQADVTTAMGFDRADDDNEDLKAALERANSVQGLSDVFAGSARLDQVIRESDLPCLHYIPETPELVALDQALMNKNRREYWLKEAVVEPLKDQYELILFDCSPNWNRLITNALVSCDLLVSPLECKINNFRNLKLFRGLIGEFQADLRLNFKHRYVPTRWAPNRKLSGEIASWYQTNLPNCSKSSVRESIQGEEASALCQSIPELAPVSAAADEIRDLAVEIWQDLGAAALKSDQTANTDAMRSQAAIEDKSKQTEAQKWQ